MTSKSASNANAGSLFQSAVQAGVLSKATMNVIRDVGEEINNALGVAIDKVDASQVLLFSDLIDDSGSIRFVAGNTEAVRDGHNLVIESLAATKQKDGILAMCLYMNRGLLYPYTPIEKAARMDTHNFNPSGGTPLYNKMVEMLAAAVAKCQEFEDAGVPCRTLNAVITDGNNEWHSGKSASDVKRLVDDMLRSENHIIAGVGIDDGGTDFEQVFTEMGIRPEWILTPKNTPSEIRKAFNVLSQSAVRASQAANFSQAAMGGFGAP